MEKDLIQERRISHCDQQRRTRLEKKKIWQQKQRQINKFNCLLQSQSSTRKSESEATSSNLYACQDGFLASAVPVLVPNDGGDCSDVIENEQSLPVRGDPDFCLDHLSPSMSTFPTMYSDDITLDIISLALSSSLSLCRLVLCKVSLFTRIYKQPSDSIPVEERSPRYDRRRQHTVTPSLSLSKRIDVVEHTQVERY